MVATPLSLPAPAPAPRRVLVPGGPLVLCALLVLGLAAALPLLCGQTQPLLTELSQPRALLALVLLALAAVSQLWPTSRTATYGWAALTLGAGVLWLSLPPVQAAQPPGAGFWVGCLALALLGLLSIHRCAQGAARGLHGLAPAALLGLWGLLFWELGVRVFSVPQVILPAPTQVFTALFSHAGELAQDTVQTVLREALAGWLLGCGAGFALALAIDRHAVLRRGLLPIASLTSAVPLVGVAPIAVMWFGFGWASKAAVVALMTFFPMLVSALAGLHAAGRLEMELMRTYAADRRQTLLLLKLPMAVPQLVTAMKINATLALIGAIVAEFFGSPTVGLGFRISTEAARMNMGVVWAAITVAAVAGSTAYALLVLLERKAAFWHPAVRNAD